MIESMASQRPILLVLDDVHWIDPTSLELLERMMSLTERAAVMLLAIFRPVRQEPSWRFHETASRDYSHRYNSVMLEPLNPERSRELVGELLHVEDLPEKVRAMITG